MSAVFDQQFGETDFKNGQIKMVKPTLVPERSWTSSLSELVHQATSSHLHQANENEAIRWVHFENTDFTDPYYAVLLNELPTKSICLKQSIVAIFGLTHGYQIWLLAQDGLCHEILSVRECPVKAVKLLPRPQRFFKIDDVDRFSASRPLIAVCDSASAGGQYCCVSISSLRSGDVVLLLKQDSPVIEMLCNCSVFLVGLSEKLIVYDCFTYCVQYTITGVATLHNPLCIPVAIGKRWLAYADSKLTKLHQSCGGYMSADSNGSYTAAVVNVAKQLSKNLSSLSDATAVAHLKVDSSRVSEVSQVTVIDMKDFQTEKSTTIHNLNSNCSAIVAHFTSLSGDSVARLEFSTNAQLLLVAGSKGHSVEMYSILSHPSGSSLSAVRHLYTLQRGATPSQIKEMRFSDDQRWVLLASQSGTIHIFATLPYGGMPCVRTHCSQRLPNRLSRFHRSAGFEPLPNSGRAGVSASHGSPSAGTSPISKEMHPSVGPLNCIGAYASQNPRLPPFPAPLLLIGSAKIKHSSLLLPTLNLGHGVSDQLSKQGNFVLPVVSMIFAPNRGARFLDPQQKLPEWSTSIHGLFIINTNGHLTEYSLEVKPVALNANKPPATGTDAPIHLTVQPVAEWLLYRHRNSVDIRPPLHEHVLLAFDNILKEKSNCTQQQNNTKLDEASWIAQVECTTYSGPSRRLWMGPQFTFKTYYYPSAQSSIMQPSDDSVFQFRRSQPISMPPHTPRSNVHSVPVVIEVGSSNSNDIQWCGLEVCGSWSDHDYLNCSSEFGDLPESALRRSLADAIASDVHGYDVTDDTAPGDDQSDQGLPFLPALDCTD